jgi:hypothetical protein
LLRLVIICPIGSNSYELYFVLHVALESCFKYIIFVELLDNIQFVVWSNLEIIKNVRAYFFLYYTSIVLVCQYIVSRIVYRGNSVVCFTKATSPPRKIILSTFAPSRKIPPLSITQVNWSFHARWFHRGKDYLLSLQSICVFLPRYIVKNINICVLNTI